MGGVSISQLLGIPDVPYLFLSHRMTAIILSNPSYSSVDIRLFPLAPEINRYREMILEAHYYSLNSKNSTHKTRSNLIFSTNLKDASPTKAPGRSKKLFPIPDEFNRDGSTAIISSLPVPIQKILPNSACPPRKTKTLRRQQLSLMN